LEAYFGYTTLAKMIYRSETALLMPFVSAGILGYVGYYVATYLTKKAAQAPRKPDAPCLNAVIPSIMVQLTLLFIILSGALGLAIDLGLLVRWVWLAFN
jgi:hypothetical protein